MKNSIIKSFCALAIIFSAASCEDFNSQFEGYDPDPEITDVQNIVLTLAEGDYSTIASNSTNVALAEEQGLTAELEAVASEKLFRSQSVAEAFLPAYLDGLYGEYLTSGSTAVVTYDFAEVLPGGEEILFEGGNDFPTVAPYGTITVSDVEFSYNNVYYNDSYGSYSFMPEVSYFANKAEMDITEIVVTEDYKYYNLTLYVGATADVIDTVVDYVKADESDEYVYTIPAGNKFFKMTNETTYTASADKIEVKTADATIDLGSEGIPTQSPNGSVTVGNYEFNYNNAYYSSYGSYTVPAGDGYISNATELVGLSQIIVTDDYSYYNFTLYVGATADNVTTKIEYTQTGDDRIYDIPEDNGFFKLVNESTYTAQGDKITLVCGETIYYTTSSSFCLADHVWGPKTYLTLGDNTTMPEYQSESEAIETFEVDGVTFEYKWAYYRTSYGSLTIAANTDGYWRNLTEMPGLSKIVVTEDYSYYNLEVYAGTASGSEDTLIEYTKSGNDYTYIIPEGYNFVKFANSSSYNASCDLIVYEFNGLE